MLLRNRPQMVDKVGTAGQAAPGSQPGCAGDPRAVSGADDRFVSSANRQADHRNRWSAPPLGVRIVARRRPGAAPHEFPPRLDWRASWMLLSNSPQRPGGCSTRAAASCLGELSTRSVLQRSQAAPESTGGAANPAQAGGPAPHTLTVVRATFLQSGSGTVYVVAMYVFAERAKK